MSKNKTVSLKEIVGQKFIGFEPDIPTRRAIDKVFKENSVTVHHVMEFDNIETVKRAVEIDAGIAIVPRGTITQEVAKQTLCELKISDAEFYRPLEKLEIVINGEVVASAGDGSQMKLTASVKLPEGSCWVAARSLTIGEVR